MLIPVLWLWMKDNQDEKYHFCQYFSLQTLDKCLKILKHCSCDVPWPGIYTFYWTISKKLKSDFHRAMLFCKHVSLDFVSIFCSCRICAWSLKFYTNQAYSIHVREQKVGFGSQGHRLKCLNQMMNIYKKVIFFIPAKTPILLKCLFISRMTKCECDVILKWTKWSRDVLLFQVSRVTSLDFHMERYEWLVRFFLHISGLFLKQSDLLTRVILLHFFKS